jgi:hypothetical protein
MKTACTLTALLALTFGTLAAGCMVGDVPEDDASSGGGGKGGGGEEDTRPFDVSGRYTVRSTFDLATNAPGTVGAVVNTLIDATDDPDDPSSWILAQLISQLPDGTIKNTLDGARQLVAGYLNDRLLQFAPRFVGTIVELSNDFGQVARNFGMIEELDIAGDAVTGEFTATHTVVGAHFKVDNVKRDLAFADYGLDDVVATNVSISLSPTRKLEIGEHRLPISYGKVLRIALDEVVIPLIDPNANDLAELLQNLVNCNAVGTMLANQYTSGVGASTIATACDAGLALGASYIYSKVNDIDRAALDFEISGTAKTVDKNNDRRLDTIQSGTWTGDTSYAGARAPLASATFYGERM